MNIIRTFAATFALMTLATASALAQDKNAAKPQAFGHVEIPKVFEQYKQRQTVARDFSAEQENYNGILRRLGTGSARFLSEVEIRQLAALYEKAKPTEEDKKRIGVLEKKGDDAAAAYKSIEQTNNPSEAQQKQFNQLDEAQKRGVDTLNSVREGFGKKLDARRIELEGKALLEVREAIGKIAAERGLTVVFTSDVAIWTANDITADVIKQLNKG